MTLEKAIKGMVTGVKCDEPYDGTGFWVKHTSGSNTVKHEFEGRKIWIASTYKDKKSSGIIINNNFPLSSLDELKKYGLTIFNQDISKFV